MLPLDGIRVIDLSTVAHIPHIEFVNRTEFPPNGGRLFQVLPA